MIDVHSLKFVPFTAAHARDFWEYFQIRPNKSYDSIPLDSFIWRDEVNIKVCLPDEHCLFMIEHDDDGIDYGTAIPFCREEELCGYFRLLEQYFNEVLGKPLRISYADAEGVAALQAAGCLENYEVEHMEAIRDYLYDAESLRTLAGRKLSKKRSHIHKFEKAFEGRWEYRTLGFGDREELLSFLEVWTEKREAAGEGQGVNGNDESFDAIEWLDLEVRGAKDILKSPELFEKIRIGGVYLDGKLAAFSIGGYNAREKMAVIEIEKAWNDVDGLYQVINQQFLLHEFPEAVLVNREDDVGLPGLRQAKMSYYPIGFEDRYRLCQKWEGTGKEPV